MSENRMLRSTLQKTGNRQRMFQQAASNAQEYKEIEIGLLKDNPINVTIYGEEDVSAFSKAIEKDGQTKDILAYPLEDGTYMIESGHRTVAAAKQAGLTTIKVHIRPRPKDQNEEVYRLITANLNTRERTPLMRAREAELLNKVFSEKAERLKVVNEALLNASEEEKETLNKEKAEIESLMEGRTPAVCTYEKLGISQGNYNKLLGLLKLIPELQVFVGGEYEDFPWSGLYGAVKLSAHQQKMLANKIALELKTSAFKQSDGNGRISRDWLVNCTKEVGAMHLYDDPDREEGYKYDRNDTRFLSEELKEELTSGKKSRNRRYNGAKKIINGIADIKTGFDADVSNIAKKDIPHVLKALEELEAEISQYKNRLTEIK